MTRAGEPLVSETTRRLTSPQAAPDRRPPQHQHLLADPAMVEKVGVVKGMHLDPQKRPKPTMNGSY
ncbi:hypothetical protein EYF80_034033 [Liparis tanakae]|uniref:Uncharacterized protein n=1 Tax=Liparis tanakae TaxID=230148 RepID=A0A4Z2GSH8_9TELE|nr:hypothetical protein EYF80_034033 [Liparis tanakae]